MAGAVNRGPGPYFEKRAIGADFMHRLSFASAKREFLRRQASTSTYSLCAYIFAVRADKSQQLALSKRRQAQGSTRHCALT